MATNTQDPSVRVAIKIIDKLMLSEKQVKHIMGEVGILQTLDHPNIVDYLETYNDPRYLYLVMEICPGGELIGDGIR